MPIDPLIFSFRAPVTLLLSLSSSVGVKMGVGRSDSSRSSRALNFRVGNFSKVVFDESRSKFIVDVLVHTY